MQVRRLSHEELLASSLMRPDRHAAWLEACRGELPSVGRQAYPCQITFHPGGISVALAGAGGSPAGEIRVVVPYLDGLLWARLPAGLRFGPGALAVPAPDCWYRLNRRSGYRVPLARPTAVRAGTRETPGSLLDISVIGARVRLSAAGPLAPDSGRLRVRLPLDGDPWADADVVRAAIGAGGRMMLGLRWADLPTSLEQRLASYVFGCERETRRALRRDGSKTAMQGPRLPGARR